MTRRAPFEQVPFDELPGEPPRSHGYAKTEPKHVEVTTPHFGSLRTHYRLVGEGPPLLLVHGLMTSSYSWRYVFEPLGERFTVYAPDLPGAGDTDKPLHTDYDPRAIGEWIGEFQRAVGIRGCPAVGNSLGGYLCMWLALRDAGAFERLVNLHSPGIPTLRLKLLGLAARLPRCAELIGWLARRNPTRWAHRHVHYYDESLKSLEEARQFAEPLATRQGSVAFGKYMTETLDAGVMQTFVELLERRRRRDSEFPVPLLLLYARQDPMVPPEIGEQLAELIPSATLEMMDEASHFAHVDAPDRFVERILPFLGA